jgi:hypothetical protein
MHDNRIGAGAIPGRSHREIPQSSRVHGLGCCDVLSVVLEPCQLAGAIDVLEARHGPLTESLERARMRWEAHTESERETDPERLEEALWDSAYAIEVLAVVRAQLPTPNHDTPITVVGPAETMSEIITSCSRGAVSGLAELIGQRPLSDRSAQERVRGAAAAVVTWIETLIDCEALNWFDFDTEFDPAGSNRQGR